VKSVLAEQQFELAHDEHCALVGPSGAGKSTLLHILAGILPPSVGRVELAGEDLYPAGGRHSAWRALRIGLVPQKLHLLPALTALENVILAQFLAGSHQSAAASRELLEALGLVEHLHQRPDELSVGEQQRVAIARAIVNRPCLLLADEPTSGLDDDNAERAVELLFAAAARAGALLIVATHDARIRGRFARQIPLVAP
jgi:putative ABC transport system ATP-binding protein